MEGTSSESFPPEYMIAKLTTILIKE